MGKDLDSAKLMGGYFLPYQIQHILGDAKKRLKAKSIRVGMTFCDAFRNVRLRLQSHRRDYLFQSKDYATALEYLEDCKRFIEVYDQTRAVVSHGEDVFNVPKFDAQGRDTGFTEEVRVGSIKFDTGGRILAFSANPNATRAYGGDVGLDEFAHHRNAAAVWAAAAGRTAWGFNIDVWSSHAGEDTQFNQFCLAAAAGEGGWSDYQVIDIHRALADGLAEKINEVQGTQYTRESFAQSLRDLLGREAFQQECECKPAGGTSPAILWSVCERAAVDYEKAGWPVARVHLDDEQVAGLFGEVQRGDREGRRARIRGWIRSVFGAVLDLPGHHCLGFDVAASGDGHLGCVYVSEVAGGQKRLKALLTMKTQDWDFIEESTAALMGGFSSVVGAGDETGLGRQVCWQLEKRFPGQFHPINFSGSKHDMGERLAAQMEGDEIAFPAGAEFRDVPADFHALRRVWIGGRAKFSEGKNMHNPDSHCDIAWAAALSLEAQTLRGAGGFYAKVIG